MSAVPANEEATILTPQPAQLDAEEKMQEQKLIRRLQMMMNLVMQTIAQDSSPHHR